MQKLIPILDNGHGVDTPGKRSPIWNDGRQLKEYEFNRDIVSRVARMLDEEGYEYRVLVPELTDVPLRARCGRANRIYDETDGRCFLVSIHANAGGGTGYEVYTSEGETKADAMATALFDRMREEFPEMKMRTNTIDGDPDKESQFYILVHTDCPAILSENFFMDNEKDCELLMSEEGRERIAAAHYRTIKQLIE